MSRNLGCEAGSTGYDAPVLSQPPTASRAATGETDDSAALHRARVDSEIRDPLLPATRRVVASEELFRLLVTSVRDYAIFMLDPEGHVATWNPGAERLKGYTAEDIIGRHFSTFYPDEDIRAGKCEYELAGAIATGRFEDEGWRIRKDGSRFWANVVITAVHDRTGRLIGFAKITRDLSDRKQAEDERERFRMFIESVQDYAMFILGPTGRVESWNLGAERIHGYRASEIVGQHFSVFYPEDDIRVGTCELELEAAARDGRFEDEGWRLRSDGTQFWANVVITAIRDDSRRLVGFAKVTRDLTERRRAEDERTARIAAERAVQAKDEFLAMLGHELRNPLAPIVTALQLLKLRGEMRGVREYQVIERQVQFMLHLVDDLLDVSRVSRGKVALKKTAVDLRDSIARGVEIASPLFDHKGHHFEIQAPSYPVMVDGDEARLSQIFANLLTNAAKYTDPAGHISVIVWQDQAEVVVEVRDDGMGLTPELQPRVFDLFVQGPQSTDGGAAAPGGLGIGLALVRSLVQLHGGQVEARSDGPGQGSTFVVRLPAGQRIAPRRAGDRISAAFSSTAVTARRILVVDDNEDARMLLADILGALGHSVRDAGDATEALAVIREFSPEVAVLDIGLPGIDGYELAVELRKQVPGPVWLIAVSGYGAPADLARGQAAGFDRHLVKPVEIRRLIDTLAELTERSEPT